MAGESQQMENLPDVPSNILRETQSLTGPRPSNANLFRVPKEKRENFKALYVPRSVCIGPYHRELETEEMKKTKLHFIRDFLNRSGNKLIGAYWKKINDMEDKVEGFYYENSEVNRKEFLEMLLVDGIFILEVLLQYHEEILDRHMANYIQRDLNKDFILLENQIPFLILKELFELFEQSSQTIFERYHLDSASKLKFLAMKFFKLNIPPFIQNDEISHLLHLFYGEHIKKPISINVLNQKTRERTIPSATELREFGVNFERSSDNNFLHVEFKNGTLKLPYMEFDETIKSRFANLVAFEEIRSLDKPVTIWSHLLKSLITNDRDVSIFVQRQMLRKEKDIVEFLCNICSNTSLNQHNHYLSELYENVYLYFESKRHRWWTGFKREYFRWPWSIGTFMWGLLTAIFVIVQFYWKAKSEDNKVKGN